MFIWLTKYEGGQILVNCEKICFAMAGGRGSCEAGAILNLGVHNEGYMFVVEDLTDIKNRIDAEEDRKLNARR